MIEIARSAGIEFTPDPDVMREDETAMAERNLIDFQKRGEVSPSFCYFIFLNYEITEKDFVL